jgi:hypothetical protein
LDTDAFTKNINFTAIGLAAAEGAATQGASAGRKLLVKAGVTVANNVVEGGIDENGKLTGKIKTNGANIVKNTAVDAISDLTTGGMINPSAKGMAAKVVKEVAGSEGNKLAKGVKTVLAKSNVNITRNLNNTVKQTSKQIVKQVPDKIGAAVENTAKTVTTPAKDEIKKKTDY